jgi:hypothetical protein
MKKSKHMQSDFLFRQAVLSALIEQGNIDPTPLKSFLISILENTNQSNNEKIGWLKEEKKLLKFFKLLFSNGFINCDFALFESHFIEREHTPNKIIWKSNLNELVYLFWRIRDEGIIPLHKNPHILLQENFLDKYEMFIKVGSLRSLLEKGIKDNKRVELIDKIITQVLSE